MTSETRTLFTPTLIVLGLVGFVGGVLADLAAPLGNGAAWVALLAALLFIGLLSLFVMATDWLTSKLALNTLLKLLLLTGGAAVIFTVWGIVAAAGPANGYLARWVTPLAELQARWLPASAPGPAAEVATVTEPAPITPAPASATTGDLLAEFAALQTTATPLADPQTPLAWYHNARYYTQMGDFDAAQVAYRHYFAEALDFIDPYTDYANFLRASTNAHDAAEQLSSLTSPQADNRAAALAAITIIADPSERLARLSEFATSQAEYGPAWYELAQEYVQALRTDYTQRQFQRLQAAFERLQTLAADEDSYGRYYLDQAQAQQQVAELAQAVAEFETVAKSLQLAFLPSFSASEARITVVLPDTSIQELRYNVDDATPITTTGMVTIAGQLRVNTTIGSLPLEPGEHTLYVDYVDRAGEVSPVYSYAYTIQPIAVNLMTQRFDKELSGFPAQVTLAVIDSEPQTLYTYRYSVNTPALDQKQQGLGEGTVIQLAPLPAGEHTLYLQAERDGVSTPVVEHSFRLE